MATRSLPECITPEELPLWVPGEVVLASDGSDWNGVKLRSYRYTSLDRDVPPISDYLIVVYREGQTEMHRKLESWQREVVVPGDVSLLTRATTSHWLWKEGIEVVHVYLTKELVERVSAEAYDRDVRDVELRDVLRMNDPTIQSIGRALADEVASDHLAGRLYADALATQLSVHLVRRYAEVSFREPRVEEGLSPMRAERVREYIEAHIADKPSLADLASVVGASEYHFLRQFRRRFGCTPHAYVIARRVDFARRLLGRNDLSLAEIAAMSGFADQSHMTRLFQRVLGTTPAALRRS
jgi:AraC family transcriptional regulator